VPGPIDPTTHRGRSGVENSAATSLAIRAAAKTGDDETVRRLMAPWKETP